jgi:hypothetical protein
MNPESNQRTAGARGHDGQGMYALRVPTTRPACTGCSNLDETEFSGSPDLLFISNDVA